jgi:hypothetical protein
MDTATENCNRILSVTMVEDPSPTMSMFDLSYVHDSMLR